MLSSHVILASCPWGPATAHGVGLPTKCMQYTWRGTPRIALSRDASAKDFFQIWHFASHTDPQPIPPYCSKASPLSSYNIWQNAKSTPPDPYRSQLTLYLTSVTKIGPEKAHFRGYLTLGPLTFDLQSQKNQSFTAETFLHAKYGGHRSNGSILWKVKILW